MPSAQICAGGVTCQLGVAVAHAVKLHFHRFHWYSIPAVASSPTFTVAGFVEYECTRNSTSNGFSCSPARSPSAFWLDRQRVGTARFAAAPDRRASNSHQKTSPARGLEYSCPASWNCTQSRTAKSALRPSGILPNRSDAKLPKTVPAGLASSCRPERCRSVPFSKSPSRLVWLTGVQPTQASIHRSCNLLPRGIVHAPLHEILRQRSDRCDLQSRLRSSPPPSWAALFDSRCPRYGPVVAPRPLLSANTASVRIFWAHLPADSAAWLTFSPASFHASCSTAARAALQIAIGYSRLACNLLNRLRKLTARTSGRAACRLR